MSSNNTVCEDAIPGTILFDGKRAIEGYALNKLLFSFNSAANREEYRNNEDAYCKKFNISARQRRALKERDVLELLEAGAHIYYLAKWGGIIGLGVQDLGALQTGMSVEEFKAMLARGGAH